MANEEANSGTATGGYYDVFLSFRGPDTRNTFADFLNVFLKSKGIRSFLDDEELRPGEKILEILRAVKNSQICIPIFSKNYASSRWCLRELKCMVESHGQSPGKQILPIFYDVDPSDLKLETELYESALRKHEEELGCDEVKPWREALTAVARIKGWHIKGQRQGEVIEKIAEEVFWNITTRKRYLPDNLVGIDDRIEDITRLLNCCDTSGVQFVIIHGIGGMGKTTLVNAVFNQLSPQFKGHSFLAYTQGGGIEKIQRKLVADLSHSLLPETYDFEEGNNMIRKLLPTKRVLLVFDGMDKNDQSMQLAKYCALCGPGSRIIITTTDKSVFSEIKEEGFEENISTRSIKIILYEMKEMHLDHALQLFNKHAFGTDSAPPDLYDLSKEVVELAGGLPLAVQVIGSHLRRQSKAEWISTLDKLKKVPPVEVQQRLKISYDALQYPQKQIFLDIACFFVNKKKTIAMYMWVDLGFYPRDEIKVLIDKSLIKIVDHHRIWMHDQLKALGREIGRREHMRKPGDRSRFWYLEAAQEKGTENAVALTPRRSGDNFTCKDFADLTNARFLKLDGGNFPGSSEDILSEIRWLGWRNCPQELKANNFVLKHLVVLKLSGNITIEKWSGWVEIMVASKLKVLKIARANSLIKTPCFSEFMSLERLVLEDFPNLVQIDHSIGKLERLIYLKIKWCPLLTELPQQIGYLNALRELILIQGFSIRHLPDSIGNLGFLSRLVVEDTGLVELPSSIKGLAGLEYLSLANCTSLNLLPDTIGELESLTVLELSGTTMEELPHSICNLRNLTLQINSSKIRTRLRGDLPPWEGIEDCFDSIRLEADWESGPKNLMEVALEKIQKKLMLIYEGLKYKEKRIFLDILIFFLDKEETQAVYIQEACFQFPKDEIDALVNKSLIRIIDHDKIWMHDLVRDFGRKIIDQEISKFPEICWYKRMIDMMKLYQRDGGQAKLPDFWNFWMSKVQFLTVVNAKEWIINRMLVAILMVTGNIAAVFAVAGRLDSGYIVPKEDSTLLAKKKFQICVIFCHTIAMICSMIACIHLILAEKSDYRKAMVASKHATALLIIALLPMFIAFLTVVILTQDKLPSLAVTTYCLGFGLFLLLLISRATFSKFARFFGTHTKLVRLLRRFFWMTRRRRGRRAGPLTSARQ